MRRGSRGGKGVEKRAWGTLTAAGVVDFEVSRAAEADLGLDHRRHPGEGRIARAALVAGGGGCAAPATTAAARQGGLEGRGAGVVPLAGDGREARDLALEVVAVFGGKGRV